MDLLPEYTTQLFVQQLAANVGTNHYPLNSEFIYFYLFKKPIYISHVVFLDIFFCVIYDAIFQKWEKFTRLWDIYKTKSLAEF